MTSTNLDGTYSATYMAQSPDGNGGYIPQATLALFKFTSTTFHGAIHVYRGGAPAQRTVEVAGQYKLQKNDARRAVDGFVYVGLLPEPGAAASLYQMLYVVRRTNDEFDFILVETRPDDPLVMARIRDRGDHGTLDLSVNAIDPPPAYPPNAIVQGTFKRCSF